MKISEKAAAWAEKIAADDAHGYDQTGRWGPDYDCSSLVISAFKAAGLDLKSTYTGNMRADFLSRGFRDVTASVALATGAGLRRGDVLLNEKSHTAICTGGGRSVHAAGNERGGAVGGRTGDQTGREITTAPYYNCPWDCVLRYEETAAGTRFAGAVDNGRETARDGGGNAAPADDGSGRRTYVVQRGDSLWSIAERELGDGTLYDLIRRENALSGYTIYPGQTLRLPETGRVTVTLTMRESAWNGLRRRAAERGGTVAALLEELFEPAG